MKNIKTKKTKKEINKMNFQYSMTLLIDFVICGWIARGIDSVPFSVFSSSFQFPFPFLVLVFIFSFSFTCFHMFPSVPILIFVAYVRFDCRKVELNKQGARPPRTAYNLPRPPPAPGPSVAPNVESQSTTHESQDALDARPPAPPRHTKKRSLRPRPKG